MALDTQTARTAAAAAGPMRNGFTLAPPHFYSPWPARYPVQNVAPLRRRALPAPAIETPPLARTMQLGLPKYSVTLPSAFFFKVGREGAPSLAILCHPIRRANRGVTVVRFRSGSLADTDGP